MSRDMYLNGTYVAEEEAKISVLDRGFLFADGVYEVTGVLQSKLIDFDEHIKRLERSLRELDMEMPLSRDQLLDIHRNLIERNQLKTGAIYLQITRGVCDRDFFYDADMKPTVVLFTQEKSKMLRSIDESTTTLVSMPDIRWKRRDIKSVALLAQVMLKMKAKRAGSPEALLVMDDGTISECGSSSFFMIKNKELYVRPLSEDILAGITRKVLIRALKEKEVKVVERYYTLEEAHNADEAFITASSIMLAPVTEIDGKPINNGQVGPIVRRLFDIHRQVVLETLL